LPKEINLLLAKGRGRDRGILRRYPLLQSPLPTITQIEAEGSKTP